MTHPIRIQAGAAAVDITPRAGIALTGYVLREGPSLGVHDLLYARALVFDDGHCQAALVVCDLLALDRRFVASARDAIEAATNIPGANVMIACTHTHSGPSTIFLHNCGEVDETWLPVLRQHIVCAVQRASDQRQNAQIGAGASHVYGLALNRRDPGGAFDPRLGVVRAADARGRTIATIVNYACHPTVLGHTNRLISADYPGQAVAAVENALGGTALFTTGAAGDANPHVRAEPDPSPLRATQPRDELHVRSAFRDARLIGQELANEVLRIHNQLILEQEPRVAVASQTVELPLLPAPSAAQLRRMATATRAELAAAERVGQSDRARILRAMVGWAQDTLLTVEQGRAPRSVPAEVQALCLGQIAFVGLPGEPFAEIGKEIRERARNPDRCFVCGYTNDDIGYIPTRSEYARGGYEIEEAHKYYGYPAALAPDAGELLVETAATLVAACTEQRAT